MLFGVHRGLKNETTLKFKMNSNKNSFFVCVAPQNSKGPQGGRIRFSGIPFFPGPKTSRTPLQPEISRNYSDDGPGHHRKVWSQDYPHPSWP